MKTSEPNMPSALIENLLPLVLDQDGPWWYNRALPPGSTAWPDMWQL
jgi:hypothetical protein